jgi:hypothetical protein
MVFEHDLYPRICDGAASQARQDRVNLTWPLRFRVNAPAAKTLTHQVDSRLDSKLRTMGAPSSSGWLRKKKKHVQGLGVVCQEKVDHPNLASPIMIVYK